MRQRQPGYAMTPIRHQSDRLQTPKQELLVPSIPDPTPREMVYWLMQVFCMGGDGLEPPTSCL
jgi:hypothetical protein